MPLLNATELDLLKEVETAHGTRLEESTASRLIDSLAVRYRTCGRDYKGARRSALRELRIHPTLWEAYCSFAGKVFGIRAGRKAKARAIKKAASPATAIRTAGPERRILRIRSDKPPVVVVLDKKGQWSF